MSKTANEKDRSKGMAGKSDGMAENRKGIAGNKADIAEAREWIAGNSADIAKDSKVIAGNRGEVAENRKEVAGDGEGIAGSRKAITEDREEIIGDRKAIVKNREELANSRKHLIENGKEISDNREKIIKRGRKKSAIWIALLILVAAVAAGGFWLASGDRKNETFMQGILTIGGNSNIRLLKQLNDNWKLPGDYSLEVIEAGGLVMEWVQKKDAKPDKAILQLHGGAYTRSLKDNGTTYRRSAVQYARLSGAGVLTVDYRVAPEHPYPAALEDAVRAYEWLLDQGYLPENTIIAGDSAGGGLTLATALYIRDNDMPMPAALITMSAWTNLKYRRWIPPYAGDDRADNPYISPFYGEFHDFPPMLMQVGGDEMLLDDTVKVAQKAREAGVAVVQTTYPGMFHVFQMLFPELPDANRAWEEVEAFIKTVYGTAAN